MDINKEISILLMVIIFILRLNVQANLLCFHRETFFSLICVVLQEFQRSIHESLQNLIHAEEESVEIISCEFMTLKELKVNSQKLIYLMSVVMKHSESICSLTRGQICKLAFS